MRKYNMQYKQNTGFTIIELMIVLVIMGILLGIAIPSFQSFIKKNNVEALQAKFGSAIGTARSEAASRNLTVTICKSNDQATCTTGGTWSNGWIVYGDKNRDAAVGADEIIDAHKNTNVNYTILAAINTLSFSSQGFLVGGTEALFTMCEPDGDEAYARGLYVSSSGLVMKTSDTDTTADGIHNNPGLPVDVADNDLVCPDT